VLWKWSTSGVWIIGWFVSEFILFPEMIPRLKTDDI
jgi:hypothetical protein